MDLKIFIDGKNVEKLLWILSIFELVETKKSENEIFNKKNPTSSPINFHSNILFKGHFKISFENVINVSLKERTWKFT
jgi:hypothetical protein